MSLGPACGVAGAHRERGSDNTNKRLRRGTGKRTNKPKGSNAGSHSALIVLMKAGNRVRRDPVEGSGAPRE